MRRVWTYEYSADKKRWVLSHRDVKAETSKHVYVENSGGTRTRLNKRQVSFSPEDALRRWSSSAEVSIKLKRKLITHLQEGLLNADLLLALADEGLLAEREEKNVPASSGHGDDRAT